MLLSICSLIYGHHTCLQWTNHSIITFTLQYFNQLSTLILNPSLEASVNSGIIDLLDETSVKTSILYSYSFGLLIRSRNTETCILITGVKYSGSYPPVQLVHFQQDHFLGHQNCSCTYYCWQHDWQTGWQLHFHLPSFKIDERMATNCVKASLPSFPDNPIVQVFHISQANFYESPISTMCIAHVKATSSLVLWALSKTLTVASKHCS